jgi:hypothetical protein
LIGDYETRLLRRPRVGLMRMLLLLWLATTLAAPGGEQTYVVKSKDTLTAIARRHELSVAALADHNHIGRNATIYVGQLLRIPNSTKPVQSSPPSQLSASVQKSIAVAPVKARRWRNIVIHHAGVDEGTLKSFDRYHREERHMENGLAYHFLIGNGQGLGDGVIAVGKRWQEQLDGGHLRSATQNRTAVGICLVGNFDKNKPTANQMRSLESLTRALLQRCKLSSSAVKTHQQINVIHTRCPGRKFPTREFLAKLKQPGK